MKHTGKLEFAGFDEWDMFQCVRRERIHPFRRANVFIRGILNGKMLDKPYGVAGPFPAQRASDVHRRFGTDKSVPYEHIPTYSNLHVGEIMEKGLFFSSKSCKLSRKKRGVD